MSTPYDGKILLVNWKGITTPGATAVETAVILRQKMPNVAGIMLKTSNGIKWQGDLPFDNDRKAITGPERIKEWVDAFAAEGLEVHVWGVPRGLKTIDLPHEADLFAQAALVPGVKSLILDVEHGEFYWQGTTANEAHILMNHIRQRIGEDVHIGLSVDGRRNRPFNIFVTPWINHVNSLHPMVYPVLFGRHKSISQHLDDAFKNMRPFNLPIIPMLQTAADFDRPTPTEITQQGVEAWRKGAAGISFFRLGSDLYSKDNQPHMGDREYTAVAAIPPKSQPQLHDAAEAAGFAADIDLQQALPPQTVYKATWDFKNSGSTTWDSSYQLTYTHEANPATSQHTRLPLSTVTTFPITELGTIDQVEPGQTVSLTVVLKLPAKPGTYATNWQLQTSDGRHFGPIRWTIATVAGTNAYELLNFENSAGDHENLMPGRRFSGIWTVRNNGTNAWSGDMRIVYTPIHRPETENSVLDLLGGKNLYSLHEVAGVDHVDPGETAALKLDFVAPQQPGNYAFNWQMQPKDGQPFGGLRWMIISVAAIIVTPPPPPDPITATIQFGMNINPNGGHGLDVERLRGLGWVRFVYWASRENNSPGEAYQKRYRHIIQSYANAGIKSLLVLHQDTEWGNAPWDHGGWELYAERFARACAGVAQACTEFSEMVAYQIYNETDSGFGSDAPYHNPSAIGIPPEKFAIVVAKAAQAIRAVDPHATIVLGGMKTGPHNAVQYLQRVQARLGGSLPVDALACHPYGRYVKHAPFNFKEIGLLADSLTVYKQAFPQLPLWITEIGVPGHSTVLGPEYYGTIATYLREIIIEIADNHSDHVPVMLWFAWSDVSENAGIVTLDGSMKAEIADAYQLMLDMGAAAITPKALAFTAGPDAEFLGFETTLINHTAVPANSSFTNRWTFRNSGTTTWDTGYKLVYAPLNGQPTNDPMVEATSFNLNAVATPNNAAPGDQIVVELTMTAPEQYGRSYASRWELRDANNKPFGHLYAQITVIPPIIAGPGTRQSKMTYLADHSIPDGTQLQAGAAFHKQWRVLNNGSRQWGDGFRLVYMAGDLQMARGVASHIVPKTAPGAEAILSIPMSAPPVSNGRSANFSSSWRLQDDRGNFFGDPLWVKITVTSSQVQTAFTLFNDTSRWYSQRDPRWVNQRLGNGNQTIGSWGCLLTCYAMMLSAYGLPITPDQINQRLQGHTPERGFRGSAVQFIAPATLLAGLVQSKNIRSRRLPDIPDTEWDPNTDPIQRIDNALASGQAVIAQVDFNLRDDNIDQHWVIIVQRTPEGDDYLIIDPITPADQIGQLRSLMSSYGQRNPSRSNNDNLRDAIKSALIYRYTGGAVGG
ncbi:MAG: cellulase family glycosylhydrolase [Anaerolineales bacterium]|nr:cellulase family glycosylhydrolase [Anaerolineales bacterium]